MQKKLIIYGVGRLAEYAAYVFDKDSSYDVVGFCIEQAYMDKKDEIITDLLPFETILNEYSRNDYILFIAIGNNLIRKKVYSIAKKEGFEFAKYISTKATYWDNLIVGENSFVSEGNILQPFTTIGKNSILFNNQIGHHCKIGDDTLVSVSTLGGNVEIGDLSYIGMGSVIKQNIIIAEKNIIGIGCVIIKNTEPNSVFTNKGTLQRNVSFEKVAHKFLN